MSISHTVGNRMLWFILTSPASNYKNSRLTNVSKGSAEWLTRDWGAAGSSLTVLCPWARHINPSLVLVQPRKTRPFITERLLMGRKESNQIEQMSVSAICSNTHCLSRDHKFYHSPAPYSHGDQSWNISCFFFLLLIQEELLSVTSEKYVHGELGNRFV